MAKKDVYGNMTFGDMSYLLDASVTGTDTSGQETPKETSIAIDKLVPFKDHPFHVDTEGEEFGQLVQSIRENGLIYPVLVRPLDDGSYEILAGHRRVAACREAGIREVPVIIRAMDDFAATVVMVHSNFYREKILVSEKARAYRMCMEAERHQGKKGVDTAELIGKDQDSRRQVYRFIRLSYLSDYFMPCLDEGKLPVNVGVELSFLDEAAQAQLIEWIGHAGRFPSIEESAKLKGAFQEEGKLTYEMILVLLSDLPKKKTPTSITFKKKDIQDYFAPDTDVGRMEDIIHMLLAKYRDGEFDAIIREDLDSHGL